MARCPFAKQRILPESGTQKKIVPAIIIDHSQAGTGSLYNYWLTGTGLECHFWVGLDGTIEQYMDTEVQADANLEANRWIEGGTGYGAISIETENSAQATYNAYKGGQGAQAFYDDPWTPAQLASLKKLHKWLADTHPTIKRQKCNAPTVGGRGLGYHSMWGTGPTPWIPYKSRGKTCPCRYRINQWNSELLPDFTNSTPIAPAPKGWLMALNDKQQTELYNWVQDLHRQWIGKQTEAGPEVLRQLLKDTERRSDEIVRDTRELVAK